MKKGQKMSAEQKAKISRANKGQIRSEEARQRMSAGRTGKGVGVPLSEEHKQKVREALVGRKMTEEQCRKMSEAHMGKPLDERRRRILIESHLGKPSWIKGKSHSEETKLKMSIAKLGKVKSDETRARMSKAQKGKIMSDQARENIRNACKFGPDHPNWRGGVTPDTDRNKPEYRRWRKAVFVRDNYTCQKCGHKATPGDGTLHAHHINEFSFNKDQRMVVENGQSLCEKCHYETDSYGFRLLHSMSKEEYLEWKQKVNEQAVDDEVNDSLA